MYLKGRRNLLWPHPLLPPSATPPTPSVSVSVAPPTPTFTSIASDQSIKEYVHSVLASFLSQPVSQFSLGSNPFVSAPMAEVPNVSHRGSAGGSDVESLLRGRQVAPSGMVPRPQEDVISSPIMSVSVASGRFDSVSGSHVPSLGQVSAPVSWVDDQSRVHGATDFGMSNISANVSDVAFPPSASTFFDLSSLLFPSSDSGFASFSFSRPLPPSSAPSMPLPVSVPPPISSLAPSAPSASVPIFSLPSVVPSLLSFSSSSSAPPLPHLSAYFSGPASLHAYALSFSTPSFPSAPAPPPGFSAPVSVSLSFSSSSASYVPSAWPVASAPSLSAPGFLQVFPLFLLLLLLLSGILRSVRLGYWGFPRSIRR